MSSLNNEAACADKHSRGGLSSSLQLRLMANDEVISLSFHFVVAACL
jgi:hypothetical protein